MKLSLPIFIGLSVLTLAACDNQEAKTPEKVTTLSESKVESMHEKMPVSDASKDETVSSVVKDKEVKNIAEVEKVEQKTVEEVKTTVEKSPVASNVKKDEMAKKVVRHAEKPRKTVTTSYLKEQKALLKVLESQYQQVRCTAEAEKLGEYSFCRQEERRLFLEIERVKGEIWLNQ
ncbi:hypothetical protein [Rodentibacter pneumotropicus]|uniref:Lipoprotein n=1 Tax=Rodentibacter pneumotropicus TaxID=758 RepID=A0A4S2PYS0_9PAST|nr:hypothetical protein [Rodentibacter pneumotropicus]TGZ98202.1 hypothetical protein D3M79_10170 [Rodentibacter pneumotropicus]TGZ99719.1 hypothetical protein D3M74_09225 [Rodentibacter pneumotropicus]THA08805.1 hypothetical protein D3M77_04050 [Rodentibacter pneumotropicus]THA14738.1 hypothetical protein D3M76_06935 [Rodentibacter pneumotropicus]